MCTPPLSWAIWAIAVHVCYLCSRPYMHRDRRINRIHVLNRYVHSSKPHSIIQTRGSDRCVFIRWSRERQLNCTVSGAGETKNRTHHKWPNTETKESGWNGQHAWYGTTHNLAIPQFSVQCSIVIGGCL